MRRGALGRWVVAAFALCASLGHASEPQRRYIGAFSNVRISEMSGDCGGISVQLWADQRSTGKPAISGVFYDASGSCPGSKSSFEIADFDPHSGQLHFTSKDAETGVVVAEFKGVLDARSLHGQFGFAHQGTGTIDSWSDVELRHLSTKDWAKVGQ